MSQLALNLFMLDIIGVSLTEYRRLWDNLHYSFFLLCSTKTQMHCIYFSKHAP